MSKSFSKLAIIQFTDGNNEWFTGGNNEWFTGRNNEWLISNNEW